MKLKKLLTIFAVLVVLIVLLATFSVYRGFSNARRIDVTALQRSDHPLFAGEKREDNSVDYLAAIDRITGEGVKPEENFGVTTMELAPDDSELRPEVRDFFAGYLPFDEKTEHRFLNTKELGDRISATPTESSLAVLIHSTTIGSFVDGGPDEKILREVIEIESPKLDYMLQELDKRPKFYVPLYDPQQRGVVIAVLLPHSQTQRHFGRWLVLRSNQRIADGRLQEAWQDIRGIYQLGNRVAQGFTIVEYLVGSALKGMANQQLQYLLNSPGITPELIDQIATQLPEVSQLPSWTASLDLGERAMLLNTYDKMVEGRFAGEEIGVEGPSGQGLPMGWIDSVKLADEWNQMVDRIIAAEEKGNVECTAELDRIGEEIRSNQLQPKDFGWMIGKAMFGAAPRTEGTKMARIFLFRTLTPAMDMVQAASVRIESQTRLIQLALAARQYEFQNQKLPTSLKELQPLVEAQVVVDPFSGGMIQLKFIEMIDGEENPEGENPVLRVLSAGSFPSPEYWRVDVVPFDQLALPHPDFTETEPN